MAAPQNYRPGASEYEVILFNHKDEYSDISRIVAEINIYEDIFSNVVKADFLIDDSQGLTESLPIVGDEYIEMAIRASVDAEKIRLKFRVYKLDKRLIAKERQHQYVLRAVSEELIDNLLTIADNYYVGKKPNEMAQAIFDEYLSAGGKTLDAEPCVNLFTATGARHHPIEFINLLTTEAQSEEFPDSSFYLFWETQKGFNFKSINKLLNESPVESYYLADPTAGEEISQDKASIKKYQIITAMSFDRSFDIMKGLTGGMLDTTVAYIDPIMKKYEEFTFSYIKDFDKLDSIAGTDGKGGGNPILPKEIGKYIETNGTSHMRLISTDFNDEDTQTLDGRITEATDPHKFHSSKRWKYYHNGVALLQSLHQYTINITVPGNSDIKAGDLINIFIPENSPLMTDDAIKYIKLFGQISPKFLVTAVMHNYKQTTGDYYTTIQGVKQSFAIEAKAPEGA